MRKLEVGDEVVKKKLKHREKGYDYSCETVVRLTPTRAVTDKDTHISNRPSKSGRFREHGGGYSDWWVRLTPELKEEADHEFALKNAHSWYIGRFGVRMPPREDALIMQKHFTELDKKANEETLNTVSTLVGEGFYIDTVDWTGKEGEKLGTCTIRIKSEDDVQEKEFVLRYVPSEYWEKIGKGELSELLKGFETFYKIKHVE